MQHHKLYNLLRQINIIQISVCSVWSVRHLNNINWFREWESWESLLKTVFRQYLQCVGLENHWLRLRVIKVRSHHNDPMPITLAESSMADSFQAGRSGLQMSSCLAPSYLADELYHPAESEFQRRLRSTPSHELSVPRTPTLNLRRPCFSSRRCTDLEQSSAAYHICSVTSRLLLSLEDILLRTLLPVITVVVPTKWQSHLWTR